MDRRPDRRWPLWLSFSLPQYGRIGGSERPVRLTGIGCSRPTRDQVPRIPTARGHTAGDRRRSSRGRPWIIELSPTPINTSALPYQPARPEQRCSGGGSSIAGLGWIVQELDELL